NGSEAHATVVAGQAGCALRGRGRRRMSAKAQVKRDQVQEGVTDASPGVGRHIHVLKPGIYALLRCHHNVRGASTRASAGGGTLSRLEFGALTGGWRCMVMHVAGFSAPAASKNALRRRISC